MTPDTATTATRATPGNPWWEFELLHALYDLDTARLTWLLDLAEADEAARAVAA